MAKTTEETTGCTASGCRKQPDQFGFCAEHFDHFKFGLITRKGKKVPDYEKKFDQYMAATRRAVKKAA